MILLLCFDTLILLFINQLILTGYLKDQKVASTVKHAVNTTFDAYRTEFSLADVSEAPIAKRRKLKKDSSKDGSSSTEGKTKACYFRYR